MFEINDKVIIKADIWKMFLEENPNLKEELPKDSMVFTVSRKINFKKNTIKNSNFTNIKYYCVADLLFDTDISFNFAVLLEESELLKAP